MDRELARLAHISGSMWLAVGLGLAELARIDGFSKLGMSSLGAYVLERCERRKRWGGEASELALRLSVLPRIRDALRCGDINWSMAKVLAKKATPATEQALLKEALSRTVRQMKAQISGPNAPDDDDETNGDGPMVTLTITDNRESIWLFEAARATVRAVSGEETPMGDIVDFIVAEAMSSMATLLPLKTELQIPDPSDDAQLAYLRERAEMKRQGEALCEARILRARADEGDLAKAHSADGLATDAVALMERTVADGPVHDAPERIDQAIRGIMKAFFARDLHLGELATRFKKADGWRRLGYGSVEQYARERLGMSDSSLDVKQLLAARLSKLPTLAEAVRSGELGFEAARLVSKVATPSTDAAWTERARARTIVQLREDVDVAEFHSRVFLVAAIEPPDGDLVAQVLALRTHIVTGASLRPIPVQSKDDRTAQNQISAREAAAAAACLEEQKRFIQKQRSAPRSLKLRARDTLRLRVPEAVRTAYRATERAYVKYRPRLVSFLHFATIALVASHAIPPDPVAYGQIYARDHFVCQNPCCRRRDVTPHHIVFRSKGGTDDDSNVISLCSKCHLLLVHSGYLTVTGTAPDKLVWTFGRRGHTVVRGRERLRREEPGSDHAREASTAA